jgi:hypothetical protein
MTVTHPQRRGRLQPQPCAHGAFLTLTADPTCPGDEGLIPGHRPTLCPDAGGPSPARTEHTDVYSRPGQTLERTISQR